MSKTLQDFRNELQERFYKEHVKCEKNGNTSVVNAFHRLLEKLDYEYGTEWQMTESAIKAEERMKAKSNPEEEEQTKLF